MRMALKLFVLGLALSTVAAQAAPKAALFVQNRAGAQLEGQLDQFNDLVSTRLTDAGFEVIRYQDVLNRFVESRAAEAEQTLRQGVEALQVAKSEGTVDGPATEASALRTSQLMEADFLVFASLISLGENKTSVQAYGTKQDISTTTLRIALRVLEGVGGTQIYGDTVAVNEKLQQNEHIQMQMGDMVNTLLDRGAVELAARVGESTTKIEKALPETTLATVMLSTPEAGAAVEMDGVAIGTTPGTFQIRPGVHEVRVTREGYATWEKSVAFRDGQTLDIPMELSAAGIARKGELEAQAIAREQSAADAQATTMQASNNYIRLEGMPQSLSIGDTEGVGEGSINVIQQK